MKSARDLRRRMAGMRDRLIHGYFAVDYALLFDVAKSNIPDLMKQIDEILNEIEKD